jgi:hypothetical protein
MDNAGRGSRACESLIIPRNLRRGISTECVALAVYMMDDSTKSPEEGSTTLDIRRSVHVLTGTVYRGLVSDRSTKLRLEMLAADSRQS